MKKNILRPLQIAWLVLAILTAHNSILALIAGADYCAGSPCLITNDCIAPCFCDISNFICADSSQSER
jgi:hypothetical protein